MILTFKTYETDVTEFDIIIPKGVTSISGMTYLSSSGITKMKLPSTLPASAITTDWFPFSTTKKLNLIEKTGNPSDLKEAINKNYARKFHAIISDTVTSIGARAFKSCIGLTSITIPDTVTSIGAWAFKSCTGLTSITILNTVTSIGVWAFQNCSLSEITYEGYHSDWVSYGLDSGFDTGITLYCLDGTYVTGQQSESGSGSGSGSSSGSGY